MSDRRDQQLHFRVSKPELERIRNKMEASGILSIGSYLRKMALDGYCLHLDLPQLRRMAYLLQMCSNNLNQYAKVWLCRFPKHSNIEVLTGAESGKTACLVSIQELLTA